MDEAKSTTPRVSTELGLGAIGGMLTGGLIGLIEGVRQSGSLTAVGGGSADGSMGMLMVAVMHVGLGFCIGAVLGALLGLGLGALNGLWLKLRGPAADPWRLRIAAALLGLGLVVLTLAAPGPLLRLLLSTGLVTPPASG